MDLCCLVAPIVGLFHPRGWRIRGVVCHVCDLGAEIPAGICSAGGHKVILPPSWSAYIPNRGTYAPPAIRGTKSGGEREHPTTALLSDTRCNLGGFDHTCYLNHAIESTQVTISAM
jgi:hypothetical protein